jgi:hypothetical protein
MDEKERIALIRKGNELYNKGDYLQAEKIYISTRYQDGLTVSGIIITMIANSLCGLQILPDRQSSGPHQ